MPAGLSEAKLTIGHSSGSRVAVGIPSDLVATAGLAFLLVGLEGGNGALLGAGIAMSAVGLTGAAIWLFILMRFDAVDFKPALATTARSQGARFKLVALGAGPNGQGGGTAGATFAF